MLAGQQNSSVGKYTCYQARWPELGVWNSHGGKRELTPKRGPRDGCILSVMYVYMYVYMCIYTYIHTHIYIYMTYIYEYIYTYISHIYLCIYIYCMYLIYMIHIWYIFTYIYVTQTHTYISPRKRSWRCEFNPQNPPKSRRREATPQSCPTDATLLHTTKKQN